MQYFIKYLANFISFTPLFTKVDFLMKNKAKS